MMEDNTVFEFMIHAMELSVVIGIGVVTWYIKTHPRKEDYESNLVDREHSDSSAHNSTSGSNQN